LIQTKKQILQEWREGKIKKREKVVVSEQSALLHDNLATQNSDAARKSGADSRDKVKNDIYTWKQRRMEQQEILQVA